MASLLFIGIQNWRGLIPIPYTQRFTSDIYMNTMTVGSAVQNYRPDCIIRNKYSDKGKEGSFQSEIQRVFSLGSIA
jgi:hypothetical protein